MVATATAERFTSMSRTRVSIDPVNPQSLPPGRVVAGRQENGQQRPTARRKLYIFGTCCSGAEASWPCGCRAMTQDDVKAFAARDWAAVSDGDALHWTGRVQRTGLGGHRRGVAEPCGSMLAGSDPEWPTADDSARDFAEHLRLKRLLDRAATCLRTSVRYSPRSVPASIPWVFAGICSVRRPQSSMALLG